MTCMRDNMSKRSIIVVFLTFIVGIGVLGQGASLKKAVQNALTNHDVVAMVQAGLDKEVVIEKIRHSTVAFDCSTEGLVALKKDGVPTDVVKVMIDRPSGAPVTKVEAEAGSSSIPGKKITSLTQVNKVAIRADSEVLRIAIEERLKELGGPAVAAGTTDADATLSFATDCGAQTISMWSGANYCTCEGSLSLVAEGGRLWTNMEKERSANAAKASKKLAEHMVKKFVSDWKRARGR